MLLALTLGLGFGLGVHHAPKHTPIGPVVDLGYARYRGANIEGVSQWLGMRYAAAPTGRLRFAEPGTPPHQDGVQMATQVRLIPTIHEWALTAGFSMAHDVSMFGLPSQTLHHRRDTVRIV